MEPGIENQDKLHQAGEQALESAAIDAPSASNVAEARRVLGKSLWSEYSKQEAAATVSYLLSDENRDAFLNYSVDTMLAAVRAIGDFTDNEIDEFKKEVLVDMTAQAKSGELHDKLILQQLEYQQIGELPPEYQARAMVQRFAKDMPLDVVEDLFEYARDKVTSVQEKKDALTLELAEVAEAKGRTYALSEEGIRDACLRVFPSSQDYLEWALSSLNMQKEVINYAALRFREAVSKSGSENARVDSEIVHDLVKNLGNGDYVEQLTFKLIQKKISQIYGEVVTFETKAANV